MAYTVETIVAEKLHSIISKNITNTRAKDFYDLYMLINEHKDKINNRNLIKAVENTFKARNTKFDIEYFKEIVSFLEDNNNLRNIFKDYQEKLDYTKYIKYEDTIASIKEIINILENELISV